MFFSWNNFLNLKLIEYSLHENDKKGVKEFHMFVNKLNACVVHSWAPLPYNPETHITHANCNKPNYHKTDIGAEVC